jgi:hypothetical protein
MKKIILSSLVAFSIFLPVQAKEFSDVGNLHSNYVAIDYLSDEGILSGYEDGAFRPEQLVNRAEAVKMILGSLQIASETDPAEIIANIFPDVLPADWFAGNVAAARKKGLVNGGADGKFYPSRTVIRAEFMKILLLGVGFNNEPWEQEQLFADVPLKQWFTPYMNYAGKSGLFYKDKFNNLYPAREMTRAEVAESLYLLRIILKAEDTDFLQAQTEQQLEQIDPYLQAGSLQDAHRASNLAVNISQQAIKVAPDDSGLLAQAKVARSYQFLVDALLAVMEGDKIMAIDLAKQAILKADEAKQLDPDMGEKAIYLVRQANQIIQQASV